MMIRQPIAVKQVLTGDELTLMDCYWHAANYLSVGQIYLLNNALLREPLRVEDTKPRLLARTPEPNQLHVHMSRVIKQRGVRPQSALVAVERARQRIVEPARVIGSEELIFRLASGVAVGSLY
jgi:phosphoketolase